jgi:hypothetical protein
MKDYSRAESAGGRVSQRVFNAHNPSALFIQTFHVWLPSGCRFAAKKFPNSFLHAALL